MKPDCKHSLGNYRLTPVCPRMRLHGSPCEQGGNEKIAGLRAPGMRAFDQSTSRGFWRKSLSLQVLSITAGRHRRSDRALALRYRRLRSPAPARAAEAPASSMAFCPWLEARPFSFRRFHPYQVFPLDCGRVASAMSRESSRIPHSIRAELLSQSANLSCLFPEFSVKGGGTRSQYPV